MTLQLILQAYIEGLRERDELDVLLPILLQAMGHSVVSIPQVGVPQAGVDVESRAIVEGIESVYMFVIKSGDITREGFFASPQGVEPSVREARLDYVRNRLTSAQQRLPKNIVIVTNGVLVQAVKAGYASLTKECAESEIHLELWDIHELARLIETHLFNESLLLAEARSDLRAAVAGLDDSEAAIRRFDRFIVSAISTADCEVDHRSVGKRFLKRAAAVAMGHAVLLGWCKRERNLKPGVVAGEMVLLRLWGEAKRFGLTESREFLTQLDQTTSLHFHALQQYFAHILPTLAQPRALAHKRPLSVFYAQAVFEELGRLATVLLIQKRFASESPAEEAAAIRDVLISLLNAHPVWQYPVFDEHSIDISLVFAALSAHGDRATVRKMILAMLNGIRHCLQADQFLPVDSDLLEDAVALHIHRSVPPRAFFKTSTLLPMLGSVAALLDDDALLATLAEMQPMYSGVTLEQWFPSSTLETGHSQRKGYIARTGVSRARTGFRRSASEERRAVLENPQGAADASSFSWRGQPWEVLVALSARHNRHPLPTWFLAECLGVGSNEKPPLSLQSGETNTGVDAPRTGI